LPDLSRKLHKGRPSRDERPFLLRRAKSDTRGTRIAHSPNNRQRVVPGLTPVCPRQEAPGPGAELQKFLCERSIFSQSYCA
jgi:hypothetical protein